MTAVDERNHCPPRRLAPCEHDAGVRPVTPRDVADWLVAAGKLTPAQGDAMATNAPLRRMRRESWMGILPRVERRDP